MILGIMSKITDVLANRATVRMCYGARVHFLANILAHAGT